MLMAVSWRSPVSTQILMPACDSLTIVSGTPSCSLSSMPVAPNSTKFFSIFSATSDN
jgi:hypothetical protein